MQTFHFRAIPLKNGGVAIVDEEDFEHLSAMNWYRRKDNYVYNRTAEGTVYLHRVVNNTPEGYDTDHINRNPLDNRKENLRTVPHHINIRNRDMQKNNTSGTTGVVWFDRYSKWQAQGKYKNRAIYLGRYEKLDDAIQARRGFDRAVRVFDEIIMETLQNLAGEKE